MRKTAACRDPVMAIDKSRVAGAKPPKHPRYQDISARRASFVAWPNKYVSQTPDSLAAAGFFYIGSADRVTCFQCGITLRDWEDEHDPETEHKRYSKNCEFIHRTNFEQLGVSTRTENSTGAGAVGRQKKTSDTGHSKGGVRNSSSKTDLSSGSAASHESSPVPTDVSSTTESSESETEEPEPDVLDTKVQTMLRFGFPLDQIISVRKNYMKTTGRDFPDVIALFEELERCKRTTEASPEVTDVKETESPQDIKNDELESQEVGVRKKRDNSSDSDDDDVSPAKAENRRLRNRGICRICKSESTCVLFLPCGHLVTCEACAGQVEDCVTCGKTILGTVKTYLT